MLGHPDTKKHSQARLCTAKVDRMGFLSLLKMEEASGLLAQVNLSVQMNFPSHSQNNYTPEN